MASHQERITPSDAEFFSNNVDTSNLSENTTKILFHSSSSSTTTTTTTTVPAGGVFELNTTAPLDINAVKSATVDTSSELPAQRHGALSAGLKRPGMSQKRELMGMISEKHARDAVMALVGSKANNNKNETLLSASVLEANQSFDVSVNSLMSGSLPRDLETTTNLSEGSTMFNNPGDHSCVGYYGAASVPDTNDSLASGDGSVKVVNENSTGLNTAMGDMLNDSRGLAEIKNIHSNFSNAHNCLDMETMLPPGCLVENKSVQALSGRTAVGDDNNMIPECPCPTDIDISTNSNHIRGTLYTPHTAVGSTHCVGTLHLSVKATDVTISTNCDDGSLAESTAVTSCIEKKGKEGIAVQGSDAIVDNTHSSVDNTPLKGIKVDTENVPVQGGLVSTRPYSYGDPKQLPLVSAHWAAEQSQQQNIGALSPNSAAAAASACGNGQGGSEITRVTNSCQLKMSVTFPEAAGLGQPQQQNWSLESDSALLDAESHELPQGDDTESDTRDSEMETINLNIATGASTPNELIDGCEVEESDTQSSLLEHGTENLPIATGGSGSCLLPGSDNPFLTSVISTSPPTLTGVSHSVSRSTTSLVTTQAAGSAALASVLSSVSASPPYTLPTNIICTSTVTDLMAAAAVANSPYPLTGNLPAVIPMSNSMLGLGPLTANVAGLLPTGTNNALTSIPFLIGCVPPNMPTVLPTNLIPLLAGGGGQALVGVPVSQMTAAMATSIQPTTQDPMNKQLLESPPQQHPQQLASQMMPQDQNKHIPSLSTVTNMITLTNSSSNNGSSNFTASAHLAAMATGSGPQSDVTMATNTAAVTFTTSTPVMQALLNAPPVIARVLPNDNALFHPGSSVPMATNDMSTPPPPRITASAVTPLPMTMNTVSKELNAENVPPTPSTPLLSSSSVIGSSSNVISMEDVSTGAVTMTMGEEGCSTGEKNTQETVPVPFGWSRHLENGAVTYYSANKMRLTSTEEVIQYLQSEGTCKCGLECPLVVNKVFNFDVSKPSKPCTAEDILMNDAMKSNLCIHKRKLLALATFQHSRLMQQQAVGTMEIGEGGNEKKKKKGDTKKSLTLKQQKKKSPKQKHKYEGVLVSQLLAERDKMLLAKNKGLGGVEEGVGGGGGPSSFQWPSAEAIISGKQQFLTDHFCDGLYGDKLQTDSSESGSTQDGMQTPKLQGLKSAQEMLMELQNQKGSKPLPNLGVDLVKEQLSGESQLNNGAGVPQGGPLPQGNLLPQGGEFPTNLHPQAMIEMQQRMMGFPPQAMQGVMGIQHGVDMMVPSGTTTGALQHHGNMGMPRHAGAGTAGANGGIPPGAGTSPHNRFPIMVQGDNFLPEFSQMQQMPMMRIPGQQRFQNFSPGMPQNMGEFNSMGPSAHPSPMHPMHNPMMSPPHNNPMVPFFNQHPHFPPGGPAGMIPLNPMINSIPDWSPPPKKKKKATKSKKQKTSSSAASVNLTNAQASKLPPESHSTTEKVANSSNGNNLSGTVASSSSRSSAKSSKIEEEKDEATIMNKVKEILGKAQLEQQMEIARKAQQLNAQGEEGIGKSKQCVVSSTVSTVVQAPSTNLTAVTVASSSGTSQCASGAHFAGAERPEKGAEEGSRHYEQAAGGGVKPFDVQLGQKQFPLDSPHPSIASKPELVPSSSSSLSSSSSSELPQNGQYIVSTADTQQNQQKHGSHNSDQISSVEMCTGASMLQVPASEVGNKGEFPVGFSAQEASPQHQQQQHLLHQQQQHLIYFQQAQQNQQQQLLQHISPVNLNQIPASMELGSVENDGGVNPSGRHISSPPSQPVRNRSHSFSSQPIMSPGRRSQSATPASSSRTTPLSMPSPGPMSPTGNVFPFPLNPNQVQGHPMFMGQGYMSAAGGPGPHLMHQFQNFPPQGIPPHGPWGLPDLQQMALLSPYQQQPDQGQSTGKKSAKGKGKKGNQNQNKNHQAMVMGPNMIPHQFQPQRFGVGFSTTAAGAAGNVKNMHQQSGFPPQPSNTGGSFPASQFLSAAARAQGQVQAHPMQGHQGQPTQGQPHMMMMANNNPQQQQQQQMMMQHLQDMPMNRMPMNHPQQIRPNMPMTFPPNNMMQGQRFPIGMQVHAPQMMMPMQSNPPNNKKQRGANKIASPNPMGPRATSSPKMAADNRVFNFPAAIPLGNVPSQEGGGAVVTPTPTKAEPSPIQLVQNMIHGLEATQNALEAAAAMRIDQTQIKGGKRSSSSSSNSSRGSSAGGCRVADRSGSTDMGYISKSPAGSTSGSEKKPSPDHSTSLDSVNLPLSSNSTAAESPAKKEMAPKLTVDTSEAMSRNSPSPGSSTVCSPGDLSGSASIMNTVVSASQHVHNMLAQSALMTTEEILRKSAPNQSNSHGVENDSLNSSFSSNSSFEAKSPASCQSRQSTPPRNSTPKGENKYKYKRRGVGARKSSTPTIASMLQMQAQGQPPMMMMGAQPPRGVVSQPHPILPQGSQQSFGTPPRLQYPGGQMRPGGMVNMGNNMAGQQLPFVSCMPVGQPAEQIMPRVHASNAHMPTPKGPLPTASAESQNTGEQGNFYDGQGHFSYGANSVQGLNADMLQQFMHRQQQNIHMCVGQSQMPPVSSAASDQGHYEGQQEDQKGHETGQGHQLGQDQDISYQGFEENHETSLQGQHISEVKQEMFEMEGDQNRSHSTWIAGQQQQEQIAQQQSAFHQAASVVPASGQESKHKYVDNSTVRSLKTEHQLPSNYITTPCSSSTYSPDAINGGESKLSGPAVAQSGVNHIQNQQQHDGQHSQAALHWPENAAVNTSQHIKGAEGGKWQLDQAVGSLPQDSMDEDHPVLTAMMNHHHDVHSNHTAKDEVDEDLGPSPQGVPNTRVKEFSGMLTDGLTGTENFQQSGGEQCQDSKVKVYRTEDSSISNYVGKGQKRALVEEDETSECESESSSMTKGMPASQRSFQVGDLVWGQVRGCPSWPGKLVNENEVRSNKCAPTEPGKFWVRWYGDHSFTQVEQDKLKTLSEGLEAHHSDGKKQRKGRKLNVNLEAAIQELMAELDRKTGTANC